MKMKILMVTHVFPPKFGGAAIQSIQLSRVLKTLGFDPDYFTDGDRAPSRWDTFQEFKVFRARTFLRKASRTKQIVYTWRLFWFLAGHPEYRIVHFHSFLGFEAVVFPLLRAMGRRLIVKLTLAGSDDPVTLKKRKLGFLLFRGLQSADRLIAISDGLFALSLESGFPREKVSLISNGVDIRRFSPVTDEQKEGLKAALGFSAYPTIFLSMGKVEDRKGYVFLLEAWEKIQQQLPSAALLIAGPDNTRTNKFYLDLERSIVENRLRNVFFPGEVQKAEDYFRIADCFLFCSRREGFGTVLVEAMCCSVPVVATNIDGVTQNLVIQPDIGRICYSRSAGEFSGLAVSFIRAKDPVKLRRAAEAVRRHFDIRRVAERYQALYRQISGQPVSLPSESRHPFLSVIIATLNRADDLKAALTSIIRQTRFPDEILIVDQSSDERTRQVTAEIQAACPDRADRFHYIRQEEKSLVKARNRGMALATGDILSFLDDDVVLFDDYFERLLEGWQKYPDAAAVSGNTLVRQPLKGWKWVIRKFLNHVFLLSHFDGKMTLSGFGYPIFEREIDRLLWVEMLPGCNMNFKRSVLGDEKFDEWFQGYSYREDAEFSYRISKKGRLLMIPEARLWHNYSTVSRLTEEQLKPMKMKNYHYVFQKFKGDGFFATLLFRYSLLGLVFADFIEYLSQRTPGKWAKLKTGISAAIEVLTFARPAGSRIKVLHVIKNFNLGGAETNLLNLIKASNPERLEVHVAYSSAGEIEQRFRRENPRLFQYARHDHKIKSPATLAIVWRLARYIVSNRIDVVHTHNFNAHVWGLLAAKLTGRKLVEHVHDFRYMDSGEFKRRKGSASQYRYIKYFKGLSDRVVVLTRQNVDFLSRKGYYPESKVREIRNGIPLEPGHYSAERSRAMLGLSAGSPVVFTSARLSPEKNIALVLDIAPQVAREVPGVQFVIAGDGPLINELQARVRSEKLSENVRFIGFYEDIHGLLSVADIFLLPSLLELHSIAILEALGMKVPVVVSRDAGCSSEIFKDGQNGFLLDPFSPDEWARTVVKLLKDPELRRLIGERGYALCREQFDVRDVAKKFEGLYAELVGR